MSEEKEHWIGLVSNSITLIHMMNQELHKLGIESSGGRHYIQIIREESEEEPELSGEMCKPEDCPVPQPQKKENNEPGGSAVSRGRGRGVKRAPSNESNCLSSIAGEGATMRVKGRGRAQSVRNAPLYETVYPEETQPVVTLPEKGPVTPLGDNRWRSAVLDTRSPAEGGRLTDLYYGISARYEDDEQALSEPSTRIHVLKPAARERPTSKKPEPETTAEKASLEGDGTEVSSSNVQPAENLRNFVPLKKATRPRSPTTFKLKKAPPSSGLKGRTSLTPDRRAGQPPPTTDHLQPLKDMNRGTRGKDIASDARQVDRPVEKEGRPVDRPRDRNRNEPLTSPPTPREPSGAKPPPDRRENKRAFGGNSPRVNELKEGRERDIFHVRVIEQRLLADEWE